MELLFTSLMSKYITTMNKIKISREEHQEIIYELIYALDDFCTRNSIRYFLAEGTLLGAVRHHGIIPWDDDADIMMEREEYERFQNLIINNPPEGYEAYSIYNTAGYYYPFIKFGKKKTLLIEPFGYVPSKGIGINIDIFPIDGCPGSDYKQACKYARNFFPRYFNLLNKRFKNIKRSRREKIYFYCHLSYYFPFVQKRFFKRIYKEAARYSCKETDFFSCISWCFYGDRAVHASSLIESTIRVPFGNRLLPIPSGYDEILRKEYGDYMTPPPEDKRESTHQHGGVYRIED